MANRKVPDSVSKNIDSKKVESIINTDILDSDDLFEEDDFDDIDEDIVEETSSNDNSKDKEKEELIKNVAEEHNLDTDNVEYYDISDIMDDEEDVGSPILQALEKGEVPKVEKIEEDDIIIPEGNNSGEIDMSFDDEDDIDFFEKGNKKKPVSLTDEPKDDPDKIYKFYKDAKISENAQKKQDFFRNIKVDLNNITLTNKSPLQQNADKIAIFDSSKPSFTVTCCQSGYSASLTGLTLTEKNAINNSSLSLFEQRQKLYKTIYNKIVHMSIPKPNFDTWLKITSFGDLNTLYFGIYCQTFIDNNEFDVTCGKCGKTTSVVVNNQTLVEIRDKNVYGQIDEIMSSMKSTQDLLDNAVLNKTQRVMLDESKLIFDISNPSLYDHLLLIKTTKSEALRDYADTLSAMLFIKNVYMLDVDNYVKNNGKIMYYPIKDREEILNILLKLSNQDGEQLEAAIEDELSKYRIDYAIHRCQCQHCHTVLPNIPVSMEDILFTRINRQRKTD